MHNTTYVALNPARLESGLWNTFLQDDITLEPDRWHLILGSKLEHNDFTGWEVQPGARLLWTPSARQTFWASVAHAVRTPSRAEEDVTLMQPGPFPGLGATITGNPAFQSETLNAFEAGYRFIPADRITVDLALFYNDYAHLGTAELSPASLALLGALQAGAPFVPPATITATSGNSVGGDTYGGEAAVAAQLTPGWRVRVSYSLLEARLHTAPGSTDFTSATTDEGSSPEHQISLSSQHSLGRGWTFDWSARYVSELPAQGIPAYVGLDARIAWRPAPGWEISLVGKNLSDPQHPEFAPSIIASPVSEVPRSFFLQVRYEH